MLSNYVSRAKQFIANRNVEKIRANDPIFVLGNQKTGSTAIAACLARASGRSVTLDVVRSIKHPEWKVEVKRGAASFDDYLFRYRREFSREIIKEPGLTFFFDELKARFPAARYVMIVRHPLDNIRSILNRLAIPGDLDVLDEEQYPRLARSKAWKLNFDGGWLGFQSSHYIDVMALRWRRCAETYQQSPDSFHLITYEDFCSDKVGEIKRLAGLLGLASDGDISSLVDTQFQSKGEAVERTIEFFGERNHNRIVSIVSGTAPLFGYTL